MPTSNTWDWLTQIATERSEWTTGEIADVLERIETHLGTRPVQLVGPTLSARWRVGDEAVVATVDDLTVVDGRAGEHVQAQARARFTVEVRDWAELQHDERRWLSYDGDGEVTTEFDSLPLWNLKVCDDAAWEPAELPEIETWNSLARACERIWTPLVFQLQMIPRTWLDQPIGFTQDTDSCVLEFSRDQLRVHKLVQAHVRPDGLPFEDFYDLTFTPEAAFRAAPLLAEQFVDQYDPNFELGDLRLEWSPASVLRVAREVSGGPPSETVERSGHSAELIALSHRATGVRTLSAMGFPSLPLALEPGTEMDLLALPIPEPVQQAAPARRPAGAAGGTGAAGAADGAAPAGAASADATPVHAAEAPAKTGATSGAAREAAPTAGAVPPVRERGVSKKAVLLVVAVLAALALLLVMVAKGVLGGGTEPEGQRGPSLSPASPPVSLSVSVSFTTPTIPTLVGGVTGGSE